MKKLNSMPDYTAHMPQQAHDVSQSTGFTAPPGQLSPVYFDMLHTGDKIHFSSSMFARLNPLSTAALGDIEMHLDYFFVPLSVMYTPSTSLFYQTDDLISSNFNRDTLKADSFPVFNFGSFTISDTAPDIEESWFLRFQNAVADPVYRSTTSIQQTTNFDCVGKNIYRMFDFLDMKPSILGESPSTASEVYPAYTPWFALAYQAIYQLYPQYRNFDRERKLYNYNIDEYYNTMEFTDDAVISSSYLNGDWSKSIFALHYIDRHRDYFNSVKVSPMGSAVSRLSGYENVFSSVNSWINNNYISLSDNDQYADDLPGATQTYSFNNGNQQVLSSNSIRQLFMVDKLLRVIGRAEKNYESQFLAHFGIKIPHDELHNITHIGHDMAILSPTPVVSSADTFNGDTGSALGELGGQGSQMLTGRKYNFKAPFHGVFMTIAYFVPRQRYVVGLNKLHNLNKVTDFWQPEFDKKGMQPLFAYEGNPFYNMSPIWSDRVGWQFAYEQFKRKFDRVSLAFSGASGNSVNTYAPWFISTTPWLQPQANGIVPTYYTRNVDWLDLKVSPTSLNGILLEPYNPAWSQEFFNNPHLIWQTDPFICDFNMHCKKVNGMSEYGEPEL